MTPVKNRPYFNRDLSWIDFNERVLLEADRNDIPLLERLKFLCIVSSNFDEFFMVRVAAMKRASKNGGGRDPAGLTADEQLAKAAVRVHELVIRQYGLLNDHILPALRREGLSLIRPADYTSRQIQYLEALYKREIQPVLTPLRVEADRNFPHTGNLRLFAAFWLFQGHDQEPSRERLAILPIPSNLGRIVWLPPEADGIKRWALLDDVILNWSYDLFTDCTIREASLFKVIRDADFSVDEERDDDFIEAMEEVLVDRELSLPVRLSISDNSPRLREELTRQLALNPEEVYEMPGPLDLGSLMEIYTVEGFDQLRETFWGNWWPPGLPKDQTLWDSIRASDQLLHHPYDSFGPVVKFLKDAAVDPQVLAIKITLYRTSGDSPIIKALERAAQNGKHVTVIVELKARFDESRNISWAIRLEQAGVVVVWGIVQLKVHAKICMVVRKEDDGVRRYLHFSTGNYNDRTVKQYSDIGLFTANREIAQDASLVFNAITGYSAAQHCRHLKTAPIDLKRRLLELISREANRSSQEYPGLIIAKMNSLVDRDIIKALYRASQAGVRIRLNVRGICMLVPGLPGLSDQIEVVSIVDHYLEHSRMVYFANGGSEELYISSADWMPRNLERRVELLIPLLDKKILKQALNILKTYFSDTSHARYLASDGVWRPKLPSEGEAPFRAQAYFNDLARTAAKAFGALPKREFVVRRRPAAAKSNQP